MRLRILLFHELNKYLDIKTGKSETYIGDTRDFSTCITLDGKAIKMEDNSVDAIVNSPPYSTALDYIRNDLPQLAILGLASLEELEHDMMGNPNLRYYPDELKKEIEQNFESFSTLPESAKQIVKSITQAGRVKEGLRTYKFFKDMRLALSEMHRVLKLNGEYIEVRNDKIIAEMEESSGFKRDSSLPLQKQLWDEKLPQIRGGIRRELEKSMSGEIRYETVLVLKKRA